MFAMKPRRQSSWLPGSLVILWLATTYPLQAQIVPDATLPNPSIVSPASPSIFNPNSNSNIITGGTEIGSNLFHSFREFSVPTGSASFQQINQGIENVISRVTGSSVSNINGLIQLLQTNRTVSSANFFLINPNGIIFGPNASLSIGGSFLASTASSLKFADGQEFSATRPDPPSLLTINVPIGLQFEGTPGSVIANESNLRVPQEKTLALIGGALILEGSSLSAESGQIELGSVAGTGLVSFTPTDIGWTLGYEGVQNFQDIRLSQEAVVDASGEGGGNIQVQGQHVVLTGGSIIEASTLGSEPGGILSVNASESVEVSGSSQDGQVLSQLLAAVDPEATGNGGDLTIKTERLLVQEGGQVLTSTVGQGNAGALNVDASEVELNGVLSGLFTTAEAEATGNGGELTIETEQLLVQNGAQVLSSTSGEGYAGNLTVRAADIELVGTGTTDADQVIVSGLLATDESISTSTPSSNPAVRTGGNLTIETEQLIVRDGAQVAVTTFSGRDAGDLTVRASQVQLIGTAPVVSGRLPAFSGLFAGADIGSTGAGGNLTIETGRLIVQDGAEAQASTLGDGDAGKLTVEASESVELSGKVVTQAEQFPSALLAVSGLASVFTEAKGQGGSIEINTPQLILRDGAAVTVSSTSTASDAKGAGNIDITAQTIRLDSVAGIAAETASGNGGDMTLQVQDLLLLRRNSNISTTAGIAGAGGNGGNISIDARFLVAPPQENSDVIANAFNGNGGNIALSSQSIFGLQYRNELAPQLNTTSDITASSRFGLAGTVTINTPDVDPSRGLVALPTNLVDASGLIAQSCRGSGRATASEQNQFIVTGRGGLPPSPNDALSTQAVWQDLRPPVHQVAESSDSEVSTEPDVKRPPAHLSPIVEAQGWVINLDGQVILTAQAPTVQPYISGLMPIGCIY